MLIHLQWKIAGNIPRVIVYGPTSHLGEFFVGQTLLTTASNARNPQPAVLSVCRESRQECIAMFELILGIQRYMMDPHTFTIIGLINDRGATYFNASSDVMLLSGRFGRRSDFSHLLSALGGLSVNMKSIAIDLDLVSNPSNLVRLVDLAHFAYDREHIKEIILVVMSQKSVVPSHGELELVEWDMASGQVVELDDRELMENELAEILVGRVFATFIKIFQHLRNDGTQRGHPNQDHMWPWIEVKGIVQAGKRV